MILHVAKCPAARNIFYNFCKIPVSNRLKAFYLLLELPSDQENKNGFAAERLWFLGHRESTLKNFVKQCVTHSHVFIQAKYPPVCFITPYGPYV